MSEQNGSDLRCFSRSASVVTLVRALKQSIFKHAGVSDNKHVSINLSGHLESGRTGVCADIFDKLLSCKQSQYADNSSWDKNEALRHFASLNFVFRRHRHFLRANRLEMLEKTLRESQTVALPLDPSSMVFSQRTPRAFAYLEHFRLLALLLELANEADWMPLSWEACEGTSHIFPYDDISAVKGPGHPSFLVKQTFTQHDHSLNSTLFSLAPTGSLDSSTGFSSLFGALPQQPLPLNALDVFFALPALPPPPDSANMGSSSNTASLLNDNSNNPIDFITVHIDRTQKTKQSGYNALAKHPKAKAFNVMGLATRHQQQRQGESSAEYRATENCKKDWRELRDTWLRKSAKVQDTSSAEQVQPSIVPDAPAWDYHYEPRTLSFEESYAKHSTHIHRNSLKQEQVLVRDILLCLQGVPSSSFLYDDHLLQFVSIPSRTKNTGVESLAGLLHSIAHVGTVYRSLEVCASELSKDPSLAGLISQSFALALLETLRHYRHSVLSCLSSCAQRRTAEGSQNNKEGSLLEVVLHSRRLTSQLCFLGGLAQINIHNRGNYISGLPQGADLLSHLYACGVMSYLEVTNAPLLRFLFQRSFTPYLRMLSEWMYRGQLIDPFNEFFVMRSEGDGDSLMYEERKDVALPIFLRTLQRLIFKCGWSLSILNKASQPHFRAVSVDAPHSPIRLCFSLKDVETLKNECDALMSEQHRKLALLDGEQITGSTPFNPGSASSSLSSATSSPTKSMPVSPMKRLSVAGREDDSNGDRKTELPPISRSNTPEITTVRVKLFDSAFSSLSSSSSAASSSASGTNTARELWQKQRQKLTPLRKEIRQTLSREWQAALLLGGDFQDVSVQAKTRRNSYDSITGRRNSHDSTGRRNSHDLTLGRRNSHDSSHNKSKLVAELSKDGQRGISNLGVGGILTLGRCSGCGSSNSNSGRRGSNGQVSNNGSSSGSSGNSMSASSSIASGGSSVDSSTSSSIGESKEKPVHVSAVARSLGLSSEVAPSNPFQNTSNESKRNTSTDNQVGAAAALARSLGILTGAIPANPFRKRSDSIGSGTTNAATVGHVSSASTTIPNTLTSTNTTTSTVTTTTATERRNSVAPPPPPPPSATTTHDKKISGSDENIPVLMSVIINKSLVQVLRSQCRMVDRATRHFFLHRLKVQQHCAAIRKYLLMGAGDFSDVLSATLLEGVARVPPVNWTAKANLRACLDYSLRQCGYHSDPLSSHLLLVYNEKADVNKAKTVTSQSIEALNSISLTYTAEWPLGLVLAPRALEVFSSAFNFFVRMKRAAKALTDVWSMHKDKEGDEDKEDEDTEKIVVVAEKPPEKPIAKVPAPKPRASVIPPLDKHTRSVHTTRFRMMHVVSGISRYVGTHVQDVLWAEFVTQLDAAESLDQLRQCHDQYAEQVLSSCFLTGGTVEASFRAVFQAALNFTEVVSNMPVRSHSAAQNQALQSIIAGFNLAVSRLHTVLKSDANAADLLSLLDLDLFDAH